MRKKQLALLYIALLIFADAAWARDQIRIAGSSTVFPFVAAAAEEFGNKTDFKTPVVESTGTGGGIKLFCGGVGAKFPDFANASRAIKTSEKDLCAGNGVKNIVEIKIGFDGIVLANRAGETVYNLTKKQIFMALARQIPAGGKLIDNPYKNWSDIDPALPASKIEVYGPPPTSGTRDALVELVMDSTCHAMPEFTVEYKDEKIREKACRAIREDGAFIEAGENDNLLIQKIHNNNKAIAILGYSFLEQNERLIQGSVIDGFAPSSDNIMSGKYPLSRPLYVYAKGEHMGWVPGMKQFLAELLSDAANNNTDGYLLRKGLIPLSDAVRNNLRQSLDISSN